MKLLALLIGAILSAASAYALGPIPNGTYVGTETCSGEAPTASRIVLTDDMMVWDSQKNAFVADSNGFFKVNSLAGHNGSGLGHFTKNGLHYEAAFDISIGNGKTVSAPGEDTFTYKNGNIYLDSSASMGPFGIIVCTGAFSETR